MDRGREIPLRPCAKQAFNMLQNMADDDSGDRDSDSDDSEENDTNIIQIDSESSRDVNEPPKEIVDHPIHIAVWPLL